MPSASEHLTCDLIHSPHLIVIEFFLQVFSYFRLRQLSLKKDLEFLLFVKTNLHIELPLQRMANILVKKNEDQVIVELCKLIEMEAKDAISRNGTFHLGLSGGSLASFLCRF